MKSMQDWNNSGLPFEQYFQLDCLVDESVIEHFRDVLPPAYFSGYKLQVGEPANHLFDKDSRQYKPTYTTFLRHPDGWHYKGECFQGCTSEPNN